MLKKKNDLLNQELTLYKEKEKCFHQELETYRKVIFKEAKTDIHDVLEMQHKKIIELETKIEVLEKKYYKLLKTTSSSHQT
jgi:hypothetical protein